MNKQQIEEAFKMLAKSQGFYCRILEYLETVTPEQKQKFYSDLEERKFKDVVELVIYMEG